MDTKFDFGSNDGERHVYVRPVLVSTLPEDVQAQAGGLTQLYSLHDAKGQQLALVRDRKMAFSLARENDLAPVSVH
ncbi:hypothetical protein BFP70_08125 [Thioclava sp. SK-1]|uniref:DUF1150 family protein n=1 Tax=Thioclava sp. SK-1 TaxID=1889770 RepID=UPI000825CB48|nr:DUF1150 family protein [Thioclava sp. SK-1]OCX66070.1 hypothetical protein BFP70_08125 [Thioclava sp. SK-1]